jgi:predicted nucleic acid-binding protein
MIILDTKVICSLMREPADKVVLRWLDLQPRISVWITAITMLEIRFGLEVMADGRRKLARVKAFTASSTRRWSAASPRLTPRPLRRRQSS